MSSFDLRGQAAVTPRTAGRLATTIEGAEWGLVLGFMCLRTLNLVQLLSTIPSPHPFVNNPRLDLVFVAVFVAGSAVVAVRLIRRRRWSPRLALLDVATSCVVLLGQATFIPASGRLNTWDAWGYAVTLGSGLSAGFAFRRRREVALCVSALMACYLWVSVIDAETADSGTAVTNSVAYLAFAATGWVIARYLRRLGHDADWFREQAAISAADAASAAEVTRHHRLLHDQATVLSLLSRQDHHPELAEALRAQAASGANRINAFLSGQDRTTRPGTLGAAVRAGARDFTDLPLTVTVDLVDHLPVPAGVASAVTDAVVTLLHNVRLHAQATSCVVHADLTTSHSGESLWEVIVRDDGLGFDASAALTPAHRNRPAFGLRGQVIEPLAALGVHTDIMSGDSGTAVTLTSITVDAAAREDTTGNRPRPRDIPGSPPRL